MFTLADKIFGLFGANAAEHDTFKVNGKGLHQRYQEKIFEDADENEIDKINRFTQYLINPDTLLSSFIPLRFESLGGYDPILASIGLNEPHMRKVLKYWMSLVGKKGTKIGYIAMFRMIGIDGTILIEEYGTTTGFDSAVTLDDTVRRFDGSSSTCSDYSIQLFGTAILTAQLMAEIMAVISFNEPINARLVRVSYYQITIPPIGD